MAADKAKNKQTHAWLVDARGIRLGEAKLWRGALESITAYARFTSLARLYPCPCPTDCVTLPNPMESLVGPLVGAAEGGPLFVDVGMLIGELATRDHAQPFIVCPATYLTGHLPEYLLRASDRRTGWVTRCPRLGHRWGHSLAA
jgi:hypothetical protein